MRNTLSCGATSWNVRAPSAIGYSYAECVYKSRAFVGNAAFSPYKYTELKPAQTVPQCRMVSVPVCTSVCLSRLAEKKR